MKAINSSNRFSIFDFLVFLLLIPVFVSAQAPGNCLIFNGTNSYVQIPDNASLNPTSQITIEAWVNPSDIHTNRYYEVYRKNGSALILLSFQDNGTILSFGLPVGGTYSELDVAITASDYEGKWTHIAVVYNGTMKKMYRNGVLIGSETISGAIASTSPAPAIIGSSIGTGEFFKGKIDELRIWNTARSQATIQANMYNVVSASLANLVAYWNFDASSGTTLADQTSNANNGTLVNSPTWVESYAMVVPTATAASGISGTGFTANWTAPAVGTVTNYLLDVSTNAAFTAPISGSPFTVASASTSFNVTGLGTRTTCYYRVRADKTSVTGQGGYSNSISVTTASTMTAPGNCLSFDGTNDFVAVPHNSAFNMSKLTIETWIYWTPALSTDIQFICGKGLEAYEIHTAGGAYGANQLRFIPTPGVYIDVANALPVNTWTHVAFVYDPGTSIAKAFINGVSVAYALTSGSKSTALSNNTNQLDIGRRSNNSFYLKGKLEEFRIWNTARTDAEVLADMQNSVNPASAGLVAYYKFDSGIAGGTNTGVITAYDETSNAFNGTLYSFALTGATSNWVESYAMVLPTATAATSATGTGFTANWTAPVVGTVTNYLLDVSTNAAFTAPIIGSPFTVSGSATSYNVTGLGTRTTCYYRLRADKTSVTGQGGYSNTISATTTSTMTSPGNGLNFDGANDFVSFGSNSALNITTGTIESWIKTTNAGSGFCGIVLKWQAYALFLKDNVLMTYDWTTNSDRSTGIALNDGKWHHIAMTFQNGVTNGSIIYIDGVQVLTFTYASVTNTYSFVLGAGKHDGSIQLFAGSIDEVRVWNTVRTAQQIQDNYKNVINSSSTGLVAYYKFDSGIASGTNTGNTTLYDETSNAINGTLTNFALTGASSNWVESYAMVVPTAAAATTASGTGFTANWTAPAVGTVTNYLLDVSANSAFSSFVSGYNALPVSGTSQAITGLSGGTTYYYRIRADKTSVTGQGGYSNTISANTSAPTILSFTPTSTGSGATVTLTGTNFTGATAVSFGGTAASSFTVVSATSITAVVAAGTSGSVSVTAPYGTATLAGFTFIPAPVITSFTPTGAGAGATVTLTGTNFAGATTVSFGGTPATSFSVVSATSITAVVAAGTSGSVSVTTPGGTGTLAGFTLKIPQTITFGTLAGKYSCDAVFSLSAGSTSGLSVSYSSSNSLVAAVNGSNVSLVGAGTATITASQAGNSNYVAATPVDQVLTVTACAAPSVASTTAAGSITASTAVSGGNVTSGNGSAVTARGVCWSRTQTPTTADSKTSDGTGTGTFVSSLTGLTAGITYYVRAYATNASGTTYGSRVSVTPLQLGTFADMNKNYGDAAFLITNPTSASSGAFSYSSSNTEVATVSGNTVTIVGGGTTTLTASQGASGVYGNVSATALLTVAKVSQTLTLSALPSALPLKDFTSIQLSASSTSGLSPVISLGSGSVATLSGSYLLQNIQQTGIVTVNVTQAGNANYTSASISQSFDVVKSNQSITFGALSDITYGDSPFSLPETSSSGLTISYTSSNTNVATVSGNVVTPTGIGSTTITASQAGNASYNAATDVSQLLTVNAQNLTWTGNASSNWNNTANWNPQAIPNSSNNVTIPDVTNDPVILASGTGTCNNHSVASGAILTVASGGSLITYGTISNSGTIDIMREITKDKWHLISSPIVSASANTFLHDYLQEWSEPASGWVDIIEPGTGLDVTKGYGLWTTQADAHTYTFSGTPNTGNQSIAITNNASGGSNIGANLVGNPYPSSIDWSGLDNTYGAVYSWVGNGTDGEGSYVSWNNGAGDGSQYIAPAQGFFIVAASAGTFTVTNADRVHYNSTFLKSGNEVTDNQLVLETESKGIADKLYLRFDQAANQDFELQNDAYKFPSGTAGLSELYSYANDQKLSIDVRPRCEVVQLGFSNSQSGDYTIKVNKVSGLTEAVLEDTQLSTFTDLFAKSYTFSYLAGESDKRFKLHFGMLSVGEKELNPILAYGYQKTAYVKIPVQITGDIYIYNTAGQLLASRVKASGISEFSLPETGTYVVKVITRSQSVVRKILVY